MLRHLSNDLRSRGDCKHTWELNSDLERTKYSERQQLRLLFLCDFLSMGSNTGKSDVTILQHMCYAIVAS